MLNGFVGNRSKIKHELSPFPLDNKFEYKLFSVLPILDGKLTEAKRNIKRNTTNR